MDAPDDIDTSAPACPKCGTPVQSTWRWCLACGFDPDGLRDQHERKIIADPAGPAEPDLTRKRGIPYDLIAILAVGLIISGAIYAVRTRNPASEVTAPTPEPISVPVTAANWAMFTPPEGGFSIEFPAPPAPETYEVPLGDATFSQHSYTAMFGSDTIAVTYVDFTPVQSTGDPKVRLETFAKQNAALIGATPNSPTALEIGGRPAIDYTIDLKGVGLNRSRAVVDGARIYNIAIIGTAPRYADFERVAASFSIKP